MLWVRVGGWAQKVREESRLAPVFLSISLSLCHHPSLTVLAARVDEALEAAVDRVGARQRHAVDQVELRLFCVVFGLESLGE